MGLSTALLAMLTEAIESDHVNVPGLMCFIVAIGMSLAMPNVNVYTVGRRLVGMSPQIVGCMTVSGYTGITVIGYAIQRLYPNWGYIIVMYVLLVVAAMGTFASALLVYSYRAHGPPEQVRPTTSLNPL